jgi:peptidylprolyl isomerase
MSAEPTIIRTEVLVEGDDGLKKEVFHEGAGPLPATGHSIEAHYTGRLLDGTVFDSSRTRGKPFVFTLGRGEVIKAWDMCFATMKKGEKAFVTGGPSYAYGASGSPPTIPANATLRFEVELLGFSKPEWEMTEEEKVAAATEAKEEGHKAFTSGDLKGGALGCGGARRASVSLLTHQPFSLLPSPPFPHCTAAYDAYERAWASAKSLYSPETAALRCTIKSNAAACSLKRKDFAAAAAEAALATQADASNAKAHFRQGCALAQLSKFAEAKAALVAAAKLAPTDAAIRAEYARVKELLEDAKKKSEGAWKGLFTKRGGVLGGHEADEAAAKAAAAGGADGALGGEKDTDDEGEGEGAAAGEAPPPAPAAEGGEKLDDE